MRSRLTRRISIPLWGIVAAVLAVLLVGGLLGNNTHLGSKELTVKTGRAMLHNTHNWLTSFDTGDPADQLAFHADAVWYSSPETDGEGVPPCLSEGRYTPVRIGYTGVEFPGGGGRAVVAWVECLSSR
jgi:hypothetical protein